MSGVIQTLIEGGYLALWGTAFLLVWYAGARLINQLHDRLAARGWLGAPRRVMAPMHRWDDLWLTVTALASGGAGLIAFAELATDWLPFPMLRVSVPPAVELVRIALAYLVLMFFLSSVSETPRWKVWWALWWAAFSLGVAAAT